MSTSEPALEKLVPEAAFVELFEARSVGFFRLGNTLLATPGRHFSRRNTFQLIEEADTLESFLDDYGARFNQTYALITEIVASVRGFAQAAHGVTHLLGRLDTYGESGWIEGETHLEAREAIDEARNFIQEHIEALLRAARAESVAIGASVTAETLPEETEGEVRMRKRLPRNLGQSELVDEEQKIAEVATKFLQACKMMEDVRVRVIPDPQKRRDFLAEVCTEERARVYEATVHNLQSTYDTHIRNTVLESRDGRLPRLRGHLSTALHLLTTVTHLVHFVERHEDPSRSESAKEKISALVDRVRVQDIILNRLLVWADRFLRDGARYAAELLPAYTNIRDLEVTLSRDAAIHARPAALVVGIVNHHGTPVELAIGEERCNAGSILEVLVAAGSNPTERRLVFHGDEAPLAHLALLFEHGLGENGLDALPAALSYLRSMP